jgi:hypothetical protein
MKTYKYLSIISVALFIGIIGYTIGLNYSVNKQISEGFGVEFPAPAIPGEFSGYWSNDSILLQENDGPDRITVIHRTMGQIWELDYMTNKEYDSAFCNYVNYKQ